MLNRIKMTSDPDAERQGQVNSGNKFSGSSLWALTHCHTHSGQLSSLPGDKEEPNAPMQAELHSVIPRTISCQSVQAARFWAESPFALVEAGRPQGRSQNCGRQWSLVKTLAQPGGLGFHFGQQTQGIILTMLLSSLGNVASTPKTPGEFCPSQPS